MTIYPEMPCLHPINDETENWMVREHWVSQLVNGKAVIIKKGMVTDGASIPRIAWRVIGHPFVKQLLPHALAHDALYAGELMTRRECDEWFLCSMKLDGVSWIKRNAIWSAVRIGGGVVWAKHTTDDVIEARRTCHVIDSDQWREIKQA